MALSVDSVSAGLTTEIAGPLAGVIVSVTVLPTGTPGVVEDHADRVRVLAGAATPATITEAE